MNGRKTHQFKNYALYKVCCKHVTHAINEFHCHSESQLLAAKGNKQFFKFVNSKLGNDAGNGQPIYLIDNRDNKLYGDIKIAETFNKEFVKNLTPSKSPLHAFVAT